MAAGVSKYLGTTPAASAVNDSLRSAVESQIYFIDAARFFTDNMFQEFRIGIDAYIAEVQATDPGNRLHRTCMLDIWPGSSSCRSLLRNRRRTNQTECDVTDRFVRIA